MRAPRCRSPHPGQHRYQVARRFHSVEYSFAGLVVIRRPFRQSPHSANQRPAESLISRTASRSSIVENAGGHGIGKRLLSDSMTRSRRTKSHAEETARILIPVLARVG